MDKNVEKTEIANFKPDSFYVFVRETKVEKKHTVIQALYDLYSNMNQENDP